MKHLVTVAICIFIALFSLAAGYFAATQRSEKPAGGHSHGPADDHGAEKDHAHGDDHSHAASPALSLQAQKNLGLEIKEAEPADFTVTRGVPAVLTSAPLSEQPLVAPLGGTVREIRLYPGAVAQAGTVAITIVRDPLPRPVLTLTDELLKPAAEETHTMLSELKRAQRGVQVVAAELDRIRNYTQGKGGAGGAAELPLLPRKTEIDLRYELAKAQEELEIAREKLRLHGMSEEELKILEEQRAHTHSEISASGWQRALTRNGLWTPQSAALLAALPEGQRTQPWTIAAIGELTAAGLAHEGLAAWLTAHPGAGAEFLSIAGLIQQGTTLQQIDELFAAQAFSPVMELRVPTVPGSEGGFISDWDVAAVHIQPGARVERGAVLALLQNRRELLLRAEPLGSDAALVLAAQHSGARLEARPLIEAEAPVLKDLSILYTDAAAQDGGAAEGAGLAGALRAHLRAENTPLRSTEGFGGRTFRSWNLRPGTRYLLRVPVKAFKDVFVVSAEALADDGPDKVVFVKNGDRFEPKKVVLLHRDHETAVLDPKHSDLFPGDEVVVRGAFGLALALKAASGQADAHAGHSHSH